MESAANFLLHTVLIEWVWGYFLNGFCLHLIRPLVVLLPLFIVFGHFGRGFGLPALFLRRDLKTRISIGLGIGALVWQALVAGYIEGYFQPRTTFAQPFGSTADNRLGFVTYSFVSLAILALIAWLSYLLRKSNERRKQRSLETKNDGNLKIAAEQIAPATKATTPEKKVENLISALPDPGGILLGLGLVSVLSSLLFLLDSLARLSLSTGILDWPTTLFFAVFLAAMITNIFLNTQSALSPAAGLLTLLHLALAVDLTVDFLLRFPFVWLFFLVGALAFGGINKYRLRIRALSEWYSKDKRIPLMGKPQQSPPPNHDTTPKYSAIAGEAAKTKKPMILVCCSGGGSRAAAWTMKVLTELERRFQTKEKPEDFASHIKLVTGASGGIFGAAYYVASLPEPGFKRGTGDPKVVPDVASGIYPSLDQLNESVRTDFLTPVVSKLVYWDLFRAAWPFGHTDHRGTAIEDSWKKHLGGWLGRTFEDLKKGEDEGWRPSLVFSPMLIEDGRQLVISNTGLGQSMRNLTRKPGSGSTPQLLSREGVEFFPLFGDDEDRLRKEFPISTACQMASNFPWLFPASSLPTVPRRRIVDAGIYDNYGVGLAGSYLFNRIDWLKENASKVLIIEIRDGLSRKEREMLSPTEKMDNPITRAFEGLTSPITGANSSRTSSNSFRNDNLLHVINESFTRILPGLPFATTAFEFPAGEDISMNYCLGEDEAQVIDGAMGIEHPEIEERIQALLKWWALP